MRFEDVERLSRTFTQVPSVMRSMIQQSPDEKEESLTWVKFETSTTFSSVVVLMSRRSSATAMSFLFSRVRWDGRL
jgi:hypothetical protein